MSSAVMVCTLSATVDSAGSKQGEPWCPTGIYATNEMIVILKYKDNGKWTCKEDQQSMVDPGGYANSVKEHGVGDNYLLADAPTGCCVAQFRGTDAQNKTTVSKIFYVGLGALITDQDGQLFLACNDKSDGFSEHKGAISFEIQVYMK